MGWLTRLAAWARARRRRSSGSTLRKVAHGGPVDGLRWSILAGPDPYGGSDDLMTSVLRERAGYRASSGMGGAKLPAGQLVNTWHGSATGLPPFVLLRADPGVSALTVHTARGHHLSLDLTKPDRRHGLRFAAAPLPEGDDPVELTVSLDDATSFTAPYNRPRQPGT